MRSVLADWRSLLLQRVIPTGLADSAYMYYTGVTQIMVGLLQLFCCLVEGFVDVG